MAGAGLLLYSTYREAVLPEEAERYWKIALMDRGSGALLPLRQLC